MELAERFAEAQRELNRSQERIRELQSKVDVLTIEKEQAVKQVQYNFKFPLQNLMSLYFSTRYRT